MSAIAMRWARRQRAGGTTDTALLNWLAARVDPGHHSRYCPVREVAAALGCSDRTVYNAYARLVSRQLLRVLRRGRAGGGRGWNRLQLLVDGPDTPLPPQHDWTGVYDPATESAKARARQADRDQRPAEQVPTEPSKPAHLAGLPQAHPGGETCTICRFEPEMVAGTNLQQLQVSSNKELNPDPKPPPPPARAVTGSATPVGVEEDEEGHPDDPQPADPAVDLDAARTVLDRLQGDLTTPLASWQQARLLPLIAGALAAGWLPGGLHREIHRGGDPGLADNPYGALRWRIRQLGPPPVVAVPDPTPAPLQTCPAGHCDGTGRFTLPDDKPAICRACHPRYRPAAAG